ncbi:putative gamma-tubulin complex component [Phaeomoniella chlamydospora]|uniref:Putative gamma-tubulin complex component n=1 Tax=Phaeomoniella chlamydospora TaxID=158046 RepID=A0A0G2HGG1_PHACM|nr:putative gamma-tubulin complex component [Phaeomoniella chlamydospora]
MLVEVQLMYLSGRACLDDGMVGAINPTDDETVEHQRDLALNASIMLQPGQAWVGEDGSTLTSSTSAAATATSASTTNTASTAAASSTVSTHSASHHSGLAAGAIAGIAVGGVAALAVIGVIFYLCGRNKALSDIVKRKHHPDDAPHDPRDSIISGTTAFSSQPKHMSNMSMRPDSEYPFPRSQPGSPGLPQYAQMQQGERSPSLRDGYPGILSQGGRSPSPGLAPAYTPIPHELPPETAGPHEILLGKQLELPLPDVNALPDLTPVRFELVGEYEPLPGLEGSQISTASSVSERQQVPEHHSDNKGSYDPLWTLPEVVSVEKLSKLLTWDTFLNPAHEEPRSAYLSEAGDRGFDVALRTQQIQLGKTVPDKEISYRKLLSALLELGLGRESTVFRYDAGQQRFLPRLERFMLSGVSWDMMDDIVEYFERHGITVKDIKLSISKIGDGKDVSQGLIALRSAVDECVLAVEQHIITRRSGIKTLLEASRLFQGSLHLLTPLKGLVDVLKSEQSEGLMVSMSVQYLENHMFCDDWIAKILQEVVQRTAAPWLSTLWRQCGIQLPGCKAIDSPDMLTSERDANADKEHLTLAVPLSLEFQDLFLECTYGLSLLQISEPEHPILSLTEPSHNTISYSLDLQAIKGIQTKALGLLQQLQGAVDDYIRYQSPNTKDCITHALAERTRVTIPGQLEDLFSNDVLGTYVGMPATSQMRNLVSMMDSHCERISIGPNFSTWLEASIWPLVTMQNAIVQRACLRLLFEKNNLRDHLRLQQQYQLFGNGEFTSRLAMSLFDPNLSSGERASARARTTFGTGLRLETRNTWPPATSEVRLVLMGLLTESFNTSSLANAIRQDSDGRAPDQLPGDLSFSIRDLTDSELDKCRDAHNIEALDFLCMSYRPSEMLASVISERSLRRYDRVFKHLLRLLRVQQVTQSMVRAVASRSNVRSTGPDERGTTKIKIEMHRFIEGLYQYTMTMAIGQPWHYFEQYLEGVERSLVEEGKGSSPSVTTVREMHDATLDRVLDALYLSNKYRQVNDLLNDVFRTILRFSATLHHDHGMAHDRAMSDHQIYHQFRSLASKLRSFLKDQSLRSITKSRTTTSAPYIKRNYHIHEADESTLAEQLLLRLDYSGYFSDTPVVT